MLKPGELLNTKFEKKMGGYKAADVDSFMVQAAALFSQQERENAELKHRLDSAQAKIAEYETEQNSLRDALLSAQKLADSIVREAQAKAETIEREASNRANTLIGDLRTDILAEQDKLARMRREVTAFRSKLMNIYRAHIELINDIPAAHGEEPVSPAEPASEPTAEPPVSEQESAAAITETETAAAQADEIEAPEEFFSAAQEPEDPAPAGESGAVKLNIRYDEESGEYIPL